MKTKNTISNYWLDDSIAWDQQLDEYDLLQGFVGKTLISVFPEVCPTKSQTVFCRTVEHEDDGNWLIISKSVSDSEEFSVSPLLYFKIPLVENHSERS